jgi:hypothetical protein
MLLATEFNIMCHFSLMDNIILFGKTGDMYFICIVTKIFYPPKNPNYSQNEGCIYIKHNDNTYYNIQVTLLPKKDEFKNSPINELLIELLKVYAKEIYKKLKKNSSKMEIKEKNNEFLYFLYDIPAYIWCVAVGMITAEL